MRTRNYIWPLFFVLFLSACQQFSPFPRWKALYEQQLAYLAETEPVSLPPDSLQHLQQLTNELLKKVAPYPNWEGWPEKEIRTLETQLRRVAGRLKSLQQQPERYNLAGWAKKKLSQPQKSLANRLDEVSGLLEKAPGYYRNGMECLDSDIEFERWDLAYLKNQRGILFLRSELPDSLTHCKEVSLEERKRIQKRIMNAESVLKQYLAFVKSRETAQADSLMYSR
jgi:DNA repair exonuclease SbcCD ATPase subunit